MSLVQYWKQSMMDLNDVALFVQVVRAGSFAEAARRLGMPPNTASRRVQELERHLGVRLMQRSTRRLVLTEAGQSFFRQCADQVEALAESARELVDGNQEPSGKVRIAAPADFFNWFTPDLVAGFLAAHPKVRLEFELDDARADLLAEGIDLAFRAGKNLEPNLIARQIGWSRASLVASPSYLAARGAPETAEELTMHDCITSPTRSSMHATWRLDGPQGEVEVAVNGRFHANNTQAQLGAAVAGLGIALLPTMITAPHLESGRLKEVLPAFGLEEIGVYFVYLSRRQQPRAVSLFIYFATAKMRSLCMIDPGPTARRRAVRQPAPADAA
jgi:DNA-binding transcriptional LysR family regulator